MLITDNGVNELLAHLSGLSGLDEKLVERCNPLIRANHYDEAVRAAFVVLEERLRALLKLPGGAGVDLAQKAFAPATGEFVERLSLSAAEIEGIRDLFVGAFKAYRNPAAHTMAGYGLDKARAIIHLVNLLLLMLDEVGESFLVPKEIAELLDRGATARLQKLLVKLQDKGIRRDKGRARAPFRATLMYLKPAWKEPKPKYAAVLYLGVAKHEPSMMFASQVLSNVPHLDVERLEERLIGAGCVRTGAAGTPVRLVLSQRNDQYTLDAIYEILRELIAEHGV